MPAPAMVWIDLAVPFNTRPGDYQTTFELLEGDRVASTLVLNIHVHDFVLPDDRHLLMVGRMEWPSLRRLYPALFETARPDLLSRKDPARAAPLKVIDQLIKLGQQHRTQVVIPQLTPQVKWPANAPPRVAWEDFDSVTLPWLNGELFADHVPLGYWPLPSTPHLASFDDKIAHAILGRRGDAFRSARLAQIFRRHDRERPPRPVERRSTVSSSPPRRRGCSQPPARAGDVPLEDEQVQFADDEQPR